MSDVSLFGIPLDAIKEVGAYIAAVVGLVLSLRWLALRHVKEQERFTKAQAERLNILEGIIKEMKKDIASRDEKIEKLHDLMLDRTVSHGHDMLSIAKQLIEEAKESRRFMREVSDALRSRPCLLDRAEHAPQDPLVPRAPSTDRTSGRA
jgi:hypothetical protein